MGFFNKFHKKLFESLIKTSVNIIEIGFRKPINNIGSGPSGLSKIGKFLTSSEKDLSKLKFDRNKKISVMIDLSDYIGEEGLDSLKKILLVQKKVLLKLLESPAILQIKKNLKR